MEQRLDDGLLKLTSAYRREASELVSSSLGCASGGASSDTADMVAASIQQSLGQNSLAESSLEPSSLDIPSSFRYCQACGSLLEAGVNGTTLRLRSVGRGRTRRRRASRLRAAEFRSKKQSVSAGGRKWRQDNPPQEKRHCHTEERDLMRVTDGTCRNIVVVTCGSCGYKLKYKGLTPVRQQVSSKLMEKSAVVPVTSPVKGLGSGDIVSLPKKPAGRMPATVSKRSKSKQRAINTAKKRNGKAKASGSGLMDFLSSLNNV